MRAMGVLPDGPFVYCGFRPAYVWVKLIDSHNYTQVQFDAYRNPYNCRKLLFLS